MTVEHPLYRRWAAMRSRCNNPNSQDWSDYGGRGIKVCAEWATFERFLSDMGDTYKEGLQLNRVDNNGDYTPTNCNWVTPSANQKNRRNSADIQSKYENVSWHKETSSWRVSIDKRGFSSEDEANQIACKLRDYLKSIT